MNDELYYKVLQRIAVALESIAQELKEETAAEKQSRIAGFKDWD